MRNRPRRMSFVHREGAGREQIQWKIDRYSHTKEGRNHVLEQERVSVQSVGVRT